MIGLLPILTRWRLGLGLAGILAALGLIAALSHYRSAYHAERALRQDDREAYANAQTQAALIAQAALRAAETRSQIKAKETDHAHESILAKARADAARYIAAHRLRGQAPQGAASPALASAESGGAQSADRSSGAAELVAVNAGDIDVCTINTARLEAAHDWAIGLETGQ